MEITRQQMSDCAYLTLLILLREEGAKLGVLYRNEVKVTMSSCTISCSTASQGFERVRLWPSPLL